MLFDLSGSHQDQLLPPPDHHRHHHLSLQLEQDHFRPHPRLRPRHPHRRLEVSLLDRLLLLCPQGILLLQNPLGFHLLYFLILQTMFLTKRSG